MPTTTERQVAADEPSLTPKLSTRWAFSPWHLGYVGLFSLLFLLFSYIPLRNTDLWCHVAYGDWIIENKMLPLEDPFQPLAAGMKVVDSAWLAQIIFASAENVGGYEALSALFATATAATFLVLSRAFFLQSRMLAVTIAGVLITLMLGWSRLATVRPENFAMLCFAVLLWLVVRSERNSDDDRRLAWSLWLGVGMLMVLWANLHGSFVCGLAVLFCSLFGRIAEVAWRTRDWEKLVTDAVVRRWLYACEIGIVASMLNPYGIDLLLYTFLFSGNANLKEVLEWQPLVILGTGGREFALSWVLLVVILRYSRRQVVVAHVLMLGLFSLAVVSGVRMLTWYAAIYALFITPHLASLASQYIPDSWLGNENAPELDESHCEGISLPKGRRWSYSLVAVLLVWIGFALSPISYLVLGGDPRSAEEVLDAATPLAIGEHLGGDPPRGQVFNPQWWGDWLVWSGPERLRPFVTTNIHVVPRQVWEDYHIILGARSGWQRALDRYNVETIVIDKDRQTVLAGLLRRSRGWRITFEDNQGLVARKRAESTPSDQDDAAPSIDLIEQDDPPSRSEPDA